MTLHAQEIVAGIRCIDCGELRLTATSGYLKAAPDGLCRCGRLSRFAQEASDIITWGAKLKGEGLKVGRWAALQGLRRATYRAGRDEPSEYMGESMPLIAATGLEARDQFDVPARWSQSKGSVADDLPV